METFLGKIQRREYIALICIMAAVGVMSLPGLVVPPARDQGIFLYHGWGLIEGLVPYRDMWDHKPPGIYYIYSIAVRLFGHRYISINILEILWRLGTVVAVYALAAKLYSKREGLIAAAFYGAWAAMACSGFWWTAQAESFMVLPLVLSVYYYLDERMSSNTICGILVGSAILLKSTAILMFLMLSCATFIIPRKTWEPFPKRAKFMGVVFGILVIALPLILYFALTFAADDLWNTVVIFNLYHSGVTFPVSEFFERFWLLFLIFIPFWLVVWVKGIFDEEERRSHLWIVTGWLVACVLMVLMQRKYFLYHYFMIIGPAAVLAARGAGIIVDFCRGRATGALRAGAGVAAIAWTLLISVGLLKIMFFANIDHYRSLEFMSGKIDKGTYFGRFIDPKGDISLIEDRAVAAYVRDRTKPDEKFLVWGFEPLVNFWASRKAPTRFNSNYPLTFEPEGDVTGRLREKWRSEFIEDMEKDPPAYIAVVHRDKNVLEKVDSAAQLENFPEFKRVISKKYLLETTIGDFALYRRQ